MRNEDIDLSDIPELEDNFFKNACRRRRNGVVQEQGQGIPDHDERCA
jgi:hypothetical protein